MKKLISFISFVLVLAFFCNIINISEVKASFGSTSPIVYRYSKNVDGEYIYTGNFYKVWTPSGSELEIPVSFGSNDAFLVVLTVLSTELNNKIDYSLSSIYGQDYVYDFFNVDGFSVDYTEIVQPTEVIESFELLSGKTFQLDFIRYYRNFYGIRQYIESYRSIERVGFFVYPKETGWPNQSIGIVISGGGSFFSEIRPLSIQYPHIVFKNVVIDEDGDGIENNSDNCPINYNIDQNDNDGDGLGDVCDVDDDNDGIIDVIDNCPLVINIEQQDNDSDYIGDICDLDDDNDEIPDETDNCVFVSNADQSDIDGDGSGDVCDIDPDGDGVVISDNCPFTPNPEQEDNDMDGVGDVCDLDDDNDDILDAFDNCPLTYNLEQDDIDFDGIGNACDNDIDGDGYENSIDTCPLIPNVSQEDSDDDGYGDSCDDDDDGDSIYDVIDNCPLMSNYGQLDSDDDGIGDVCDGDLDGDGVNNTDDNCPSKPNGNQNDWDIDGQGDACDLDRDGDGVNNDQDECAFTLLGEIVDSQNGCSIEQLIPCIGPRGTTEDWKNHGQYIKNLNQVLKVFFDQGLISDTEREDIHDIAAESECGK